MSQCAAISEVLRDGDWHSIQEIHAIVGPCRLNSRIAELRSRGHNIICHRETTHHDRGRPVVVYRYRLIGSLDAGEPRDAYGRPAGTGAAASKSLGASPASSESVGDLAKRALLTRDTPTPSEPVRSLSLDEYGVEREVREANEEFPGLLVEEETPLSVAENRERLAELQQVLWGKAA